MKSDEDIAALYQERVKALASVHASMQQFEDYINDRDPVPLAELDRNELSAIANLARGGLEGMAERIGSILPLPDWPSVRPGMKEHDQRAQRRKRASLAWWEDNDMQGVLTLRAEYLLGHAAAPVSVLPNPTTGIPTWRVLNPRTVLPAPTANPLDMTPENCITAYTQSWSYLVKTYGDRVANLKRPKDTRPDTPFVFLQYIDCDQITTLAGSTTPDATYGTIGTQSFVRLDSMPNKANRPLVFIPAMNRLGGLRAKFAGTQGIHQMRAKIVALAYITASKGASPDTWLEATDSNVEPEIVRYYDPKEGTPGVVAGGRINTIQVNPSASSLQMASILEREIRISGGVPAALTGEAPTTVQTGRLASGLLGNAIDFTVQQGHNKFERSLALELKAAAAIVKYWTPGPRSFYVSWKGAKGQVDYDPAKDFDSEHVVVQYPMAGSDLNNDIIRAEGKVATKMWSLQTARENDPETADPEREHDRVTTEALENALLTSILQQAAAPDGPWQPADLARLMTLVRGDKVELAEAVAQVHKEAQQRQATPAAPGSPEAQPGLSIPGQGQEQPAAPQGPPSLSGLAGVLGQLRSVQPQAA